MFNADFYPTPREVFDMMGVDCYGKIVLEPSAGKGDLVNYLHEGGASEILACEYEGDLRKILENRPCRIIGKDFFDITSEDVSHIQMIVMNPPFSNGDKHILHAWEIAPEGCEIISLCNYETIRKDSWGSRRELKSVINDYGVSSNLGNVFRQAERKTNVEVGLVRLFKPIVSTGFDYEGFFMDNEPENNHAGVIQYSEIRAIVNTYIASLKAYDAADEAARVMKGYTRNVGFEYGFNCSVEYNGRAVDKIGFIKAFQKHCWKHVFKKLEVDKYVTSKVMEDINAFVETQSQYPFTVKNIYAMLDLIIGNRHDIMNRAIVDAVDKITRHTHENRHSVEGWKTNDGHLLSRKFIINYVSEINYTKGYKIKTYASNWRYIEDLTKAICYLTGTGYDKLPSVNSSSAQLDANGNPILLSSYSNEVIPTDVHGKPLGNYEGRIRVKGEGEFETNKWYDWGFFEFKIFKKGTGHFRFKDEKVWERLNAAYAKAKGAVLPETIKTKKAA